MRLATALALLLALCAPALAQSDNDPVALITAIYKTYTANEHDDPGQAGEDDVYSKRLQALFDKDAAERPEGDEGRLDFDPFVDGQDWELSGLKISQVYRSGGEARVRAVFANFGEPRNVVFNLVREDGRWRIDDIAETLPPRWILSKILVGAPDAFPDEKAQ
jgi:Protein of unknown function (DUF3828)